MAQKPAQKSAPNMQHELREVLRDSFFSDAPPAPRPRKRAASDAKAKPLHYEVICISIYQEDLKRLDQKVSDLKSRGHRKMNRSALIRFALDSVDLAKLPRSY